VLRVVVTMVSRVVNLFFLDVVAFIRVETKASHPQNRTICSVPLVQHSLWLAVREV